MKETIGLSGDDLLPADGIQAVFPEEVALEQFLKWSRIYSQEPGGASAVSDSLPQCMQGLVGRRAAGDRAGRVAQVDSSIHQLSDLSSKLGQPPLTGARGTWASSCVEWGQRWRGHHLRGPTFPVCPPHPTVHCPGRIPRSPSGNPFLNTLKCFNLLHPPPWPRGRDTQAQSN